LGAGGLYMNATPHPRPLSPEGQGEKVLKSAALPLARQVEAVYQRFDSALRPGQRPLIEDHVGSLPEPARVALLPELLELELSCRRRAGEVVRAEEYRRRFPDYAALIGSIIREHAVEVAAAADQNQAASALATGPDR